jgi:hypothetical protein
MLLCAAGYRARASEPVAYCVAFHPGNSAEWENKCGFRVVMLWVDHGVCTAKLPCGLDISAHDREPSIEVQGDAIVGACKYPDVPTLNTGGFSFDCSAEDKTYQSGSCAPWTACGRAKEAAAPARSTNARGKSAHGPPATAARAPGSAAPPAGTGAAAGTSTPPSGAAAGGAVLVLVDAAGDRGELLVARTLEAARADAQVLEERERAFQGQDSRFVMAREILSGTGAGWVAMVQGSGTVGAAGQTLSAANAVRLALTDFAQKNGRYRFKDRMQVFWALVAGDGSESVFCKFEPEFPTPGYIASPALHRWQGDPKGWKTEGLGTADHWLDADTCGGIDASAGQELVRQGVPVNID